MSTQPSPRSSTLSEDQTESSTSARDTNLTSRQRPCADMDNRGGLGSYETSDTQPKASIWTRWRISRGKSDNPCIATERTISPEHSASIFSKLYFQWLFSILALGHKRPLELNDVWAVIPARMVSSRSQQFNLAFGTRQEQSRSLVWALYDTFKLDFWIAGICQLLSGCIQVLSPFVLKYVILEIQYAYNARSAGRDPPSLKRGIGLVAGLFLMQMLESVCTSHYYYRAMLMGGQARALLIARIFEKSMKLSSRAKLDGGRSFDHGWTDGSINALMSNDVSRIDTAAVSIHRLWVAPIQVVLAVALLCINLSYSALVGFAAICCVTPLLAQAVRSLYVRRTRINKITDERVRLMQETFSSIREVKMFTWEPGLLSRLESIRATETRQIAWLMSIKNAILALSVVLPIMASMLTFITFSLTNHDLEAAPIFSSLALFRVLGIPLEMIPLALGRVVDANASIKRLTAFFGAEEREDYAVLSEEQERAVNVVNGSFTWEIDSLLPGSQSNKRASLQKKEVIVDVRITPATVEAADINTTEHAIPELSDRASTPLSVDSQQSGSSFHLRNLNFSIGRQELVAVIGSIGSGKSSLIAALSGEMRRLNGNVVFGGSRALTSQTPWIQNATFRENILFGHTLEIGRYNAVLDACALRPDLDLLPDGDQTEIGERGVTLSGGQKQRVNIARAIYSNAEILLLDDPLSAVDTLVGQHILNQAICGMLSKKCRILVTHQSYVLPHTDRIICMREGVITKIGTYQELSRDPDFQTLMQTAATHEFSLTPHDYLPDGEERQPLLDQATTSKEPQTLMQAEERAKGNVSWAVYRDFIAASGSMWNLMLILASLLLSQACSIVTSLWLSWWTSNQYDLQTAAYISTYVALGVGQALIVYIYCNVITTLCTIAGRRLVDQAMARTIGATVAFFDTTPLGRITNRFSKDVDSIDNRLTDNLRFLLYLGANLLSVFGLVTAYYHYFAVVYVPLAIAFVYATSFYRPAAREIKRHEALLRSTVFARFLEGVTGAATLRAYGAENRFLASIVDALDSMNGAYFLTFAGQRWLSLRLDALGNILVLVTGILTITTRFDISPSIAGLVLAYILSIVQLFQELVHVYADTQNDMNSTERLSHYARELEQEEKPDIGRIKAPAGWPQAGEIILDDVRMRYRVGLPDVLHDLTIQVKAGERLGIIGRTGAGKSSIMTALLRLSELNSGQITIDGVDIARLALRDLRSRVSVIPQDPTLFSGTIRSNLDPFGERADLQLWNALRMVGLLGAETAGNDGDQYISLDAVVADGGSNFSHGQRQLLGLARVLVKDSQIIMCDEATSSVDQETDTRVQRTMLQVFEGKTLLCIAHRLSTVIGYDRILVMDSGTAAEFDEPIKLYDDGGIFRGMCDSSGISRDAISSSRSRVLSST